jgi:putative HD superfamily hydrolase of NAD metabolism
MEKSKSAARASGRHHHVGIPDDLTMEVASKWTAGRVSKKRFHHIQGVVAVGGQLARALNVDPFPVELACMLHDSSKELGASDLIILAKSRGMELVPHEEEHGHVLHGPVGAMIASETFGLTNMDVLAAIAEHTLGNLDMCIISKLVYIADKIEESRPVEATATIWEALGTDALQLQTFAKNHDHRKHGKHINHAEKLNLNLNAAILASCNMVLGHMVKKNKPIHPRSVEVRNNFLMLVKQKEAGQHD